MGWDGILKGTGMNVWNGDEGVGKNEGNSIVCEVYTSVIPCRLLCLSFVFLCMPV